MVEISKILDIKQHIVQQNKNGDWYFPAKIAKKRGENYYLIFCAFFAFDVLQCLFFTKLNIWEMGTIYSTTIVGLTLSELLYRSYLFFGESKHLRSVYDNNYTTLIKDLCNFSHETKVATIISLFFGLIALLAKGVSFNKWNGPFFFLFSIFRTFLVSKMLNLRFGPIYKSFKLFENDALDYGSGMAYSFFYGYLNILLKKSGNENKSLIELMNNYQNNEGIKLSFPKLFILIPKSCECFPSLMDNHFPSVEDSKSLDEKIMSVAAVKDRVYKNSVYKIKIDGEQGLLTRIYVCAEYATPLKTFNEVCKHNGKHSAFYKKHRQDIVFNFYNTLKEILESHKEFTDYVDLIYYDDCPNEKYLDVGKVILSRIKQIHRKQKQKDE